MAADPVIIERYLSGLIAAGAVFDERDAIADLCWHEDQRKPRRSTREFAARWGWTQSRVARLIRQRLSGDSAVTQERLSGDSENVDSSKKYTTGDSAVTQERLSGDSAVTQRIDIDRARTRLQTQTPDSENPPLPPRGGRARGEDGLSQKDKNAGWTAETFPVLAAWRDVLGSRPPPILPRIVRRLMLPAGHPQGAMLASDYPGRSFAGFTAGQIAGAVETLAQAGHKPTVDNLIKHTVGLMVRDAPGSPVRVTSARLMTFDEASAEARKRGFGEKWQRIFLLVHSPGPDGKEPDGKARWIDPSHRHLFPDGYSVTEPTNGHVNPQIEQRI